LKIKVPVEVTENCEEVEMALESVTAGCGVTKPCRPQTGDDTDAAGPLGPSRRRWLNYRPTSTAGLVVGGISLCAEPGCRRGRPPPVVVGEGGRREQGEDQGGSSQGCGSVGRFRGLVGKHAGIVRAAHERAGFGPRSPEADVSEERP